jgi:hypothetical protein
MSSFKQEYSSTIAPNSNSFIESYFSAVSTESPGDISNKDRSKWNFQDSFNVLKRISETNNSSHEMEIFDNRDQYLINKYKCKSNKWRLKSKPPKKTKIKVGNPPSQYMYVDNITDLLDTKIETSLVFVSKLQGELRSRPETPYILQKVSRILEGRFLSIGLSEHKNKKQIKIRGCLELPFFIWPQSVEFTETCYSLCSQDTFYQYNTYRLKRKPSTKKEIKKYNKEKMQQKVLHIKPKTKLKENIEIPNIEDIEDKE